MPNVHQANTPITFNGTSYNFPRSHQRKAPINAIDAASQAARAVLLDKIDRFLRTLKPEEVAAIPADDDELARRSHGARGILHPHPPQSVEVVLARDGQAIVGALLLKRTWLEETFDKSRGDNDSEAATIRKMFDLGSWLNGFDRRLGAWLSRELEFLEFEPWLADVDSFLDILEGSSTSWPRERLTRFLSLPIAQEWILYARNGSPQQRRRLKAILFRQLPEGRGAPQKGSSKSTAAEVKASVKAAGVRLAEGFAVCKRHRQAGGYKSSPQVIARELRAIGYGDAEVQSILNSRRLSGAANRLVASKSHGRYTVASVSAMASKR